MYYTCLFLQYICLKTDGKFINSKKILISSKLFLKSFIMEVISSIISFLSFINICVLYMFLFDCWLLFIIPFPIRPNNFYINWNLRKLMVKIKPSHKNIKTILYSHLLCWTKFTAIFVGTNWDGPSFLLCLSRINFILASSVASIFFIFALKF